MTVETDPLNATSTFAYDAASQLTSRVDRPGRIKEFEYDVLGRGVGETWKSAAGATIQLLTFAYDAVSNRTVAALRGYPKSLPLKVKDIGSGGRGHDFRGVS